MTRSRPPRQWAYVYQLVPPFDEPKLASIGDMLVGENSLARRRRSQWVAQLVVEAGQARILVVCESPAQDRKVNRRVEAHLRQLDTGFSVTVPMAIGDDITPITRAHRDPD